MRRATLLLGLLLPTGAAAQPAPAVLLMPTSVLGAIRQYLGSRPHDEVAGLINALEACAGLQAPGKEPRPMAQECRPVADALAQQAQERARLADDETRLKKD